METITTQPLQTDRLENIENSPTGDTANSGNYGLEEKLTETTAIFTSADQLEDNVNEEKKKAPQSQTSDVLVDCCCVNPYSNDADAFCLYCLCNCICDFFRCMGECTEHCFDCCAECLSGCCDDNGGCMECCCGDSSGVVEGSGDCFSGCTDCCTSCDCSG